MEHLVLRDMCLTPKDLDAILHGLHTLPRDIICLSSNYNSPDSGVSEGSVATPAPALPVALTALTHLDMSKNRLFLGDGGEYGGDICAVAIAYSLSRLTGLMHLDLGDNDDLYDGPGNAVSAAAIAVLGIQLPASLTFLSLANNSFGAECITVLAAPPSLQRLTALKSLSLGGNARLGDSDAAWASGMRAIAHSLQRTPFLTHLDLSDTKIGAQVLADCLQHTRKLRSLNIGCNSNLCDVDAAIFLGSLLGLSSLTEVIGIEYMITEGNIASFKAAFDMPGRIEVKWLKY